MIQTKEAKTSNGTIEYITAGEGPSVVLLPGAGCSALFNWQPTLERLESNYKLIAISLPGAGGTRWVKDTVTLDDLVMSVKACTDQERFDSYSVIGYSLGSVVALAMGSKSAGQVKKIMAISPWQASARQEFLFDLWCKLIPMQNDILGRVNALLGFGLNSQLAMDKGAFDGALQITQNTGVNSDFLKTIVAAMGMDIMPYLKDIISRTKVVGFTQDMMAPAAHAKSIAAAIKGAQFVELSGGHAGFWEAGEQLNAEIDSFLI